MSHVSKQAASHPAATKQKSAPVTKAAKPPKPPESNDPAAVDAFFAQLDHPLKAELQAVRAALLAADPSITEGIKWNSPSFYRNGWFATMNLRAKKGVQLVLHLGAKLRDGVDAKSAVADPARLLEWLGPDRASVALLDAAQIRRQLPALQALAQSWSRQLVQA